MTPPPKRAPWAGPVPVALLLALHVALLVDAARRDAATFDEPLFVAGALATQRGDHRLFPEGGALPQRLQAIPLRLAGVSLPDDAVEWRGSDGNALGFRLLYRSGQDPRRVLFLARIPIILASLALGLLVHAIARRLLGAAPALVALALHSLSPVVLANGHLATADLLAALGLLSATWAADACLRRVTWARLVASCACTALAFVAKFSAVLLLPIVGCLALVRLASRAPMRVALAGSRRTLRSSTARAGTVAGLVVVHAAAVVLTIWLFHDFRWSAMNAPDPAARMKGGGWEAIADDGALGTAVSVAREQHLLPEAWLFGLRFTLAHAEARRAYAEGRYSLDGWWWFFPRMTLLKTPLCALALAALGAVALVLAWRNGERLVAASGEAVAANEPEASWAHGTAARDLLALAPLLALAGTCGTVAMVSNLNIGLRHVLPALPVLSIVGGAAWRLASVSPRVRSALVALVAGAALEGLSAHPHHVAWMNLAAGPRTQRWTHAVDSSLDWGQGLAFVRDAVAGRPEPTWLASFGPADPAAEGLSARGLRGFPDRWRVADGSLPGAGTFVVSATVLVQLTSRTCPGPWRPLYERWWQDAERDVARWREADAERRRALLDRDGRDAWAVRLMRHDDLVTGRLCASLRHRAPDLAIAGGALLAWTLDDQDVRDALFGAPAELETEVPIPFPIAPYGAQGSP